MKTLSLGFIGRVLRRFFALDRRYGVRYNGTLERTGYYTRHEAEAWLAAHCAVGVVFYYDPIDLRCIANEGLKRARYV